MNQFLRQLTPTQQVAALFFFVFGVLTLVSVTTLLLSLGIRYLGSKSASRLTPIVLFGKSRTCPIEAFTV